MRHTKQSRRAVALALLLAAACADEPPVNEPRVGVVDIQQAFQRSPLVMVAALELKGELGAAQRDLKERGRALAQLRQQLEHGGLSLDAEQQAQAEARIVEETTRLTELQRQYRADLAAAQERQGAAMIARVEAVAREVARQEGLTLLVEKDGILYPDEGVGVTRVDITEQVFRALLEKINPPEIPAEPDP